jgi:hypothetical protein
VGVRDGVTCLGISSLLVVLDLCGGGQHERFSSWD